MVAKISVFILHWHSLSKLCQWGAFYKHLILHPWFNQGEWLEWLSMYPKNHDCITCINLFLHYMHQSIFALIASFFFCFCITCINLFIAYHKNDFEILTITMVCPVSKSNHRIKRNHMIKFAWSTCIVSR